MLLFKIPLAMHYLHMHTMRFLIGNPQKKGSAEYTWRTIYLRILECNVL